MDSIQPHDVEFIEARRFTITEISRFFLIPPHITTVLVRDGLEKQIEAALHDPSCAEPVDEAIRLLDALDGDPDLEPEPDLEDSHDREHETSDFEPDADSEPDCDDEREEGC